MLAARYLLRLRRAAMRVLGDPAAAEDVAQDALLRAWMRAATYDRKQASVATWLHRIAVNAAIDRVRAARPDHRDPRRPARPGRPRRRSPSPAGSASQLLAEAIASLPARQRTAITLTYGEGWSGQDAARRARASRPARSKACCTAAASWCAPTWRRATHERGSTVAAGWSGCCGPAGPTWPPGRRRSGAAALALLRRNAGRAAGLADALAGEDAPEPDPRRPVRGCSAACAAASAPLPPLMRGMRWSALLACVAAGLYLGAGDRPTPDAATDLFTSAQTVSLRRSRSVIDQ